MIHVEASRIISARPEVIYAIFTDYRVSHPAILPKPYFASLVVEEGGQGAGTIFRLQMNVMGTKTDLRMVVSEPQPGRVLMEEDKTAGIVTTFTVEPISAEETRVTLATDFRSSPGIKGWIEGLLNPLITRRIYRQELQLVADYVQQHP